MYESAGRNPPYGPKEGFRGQRKNNTTMADPSQLLSGCLLLVLSSDLPLTYLSNLPPAPKDDQNFTARNTVREIRDDQVYETLVSPAFAGLTWRIASITALPFFLVS